MKESNNTYIHWLTAIVIVLTLAVLGDAYAAPPAVSGPIACKVISPSYSATYSPFASGNHMTTMSFEVTCSRSTDLSATTVLYQVRSLQGNQPQGGSNRAVLAGAPPKFINYDLYLDATCSTLWRGQDRIENNNLLLAAGATTATAMHTFYACIPAGQTSVVFGNPYSDSVVLDLINVRGNPGTPDMTLQTNGNLQVNINVPKTCSISTAPGSVAFGTYVAFGPAKTASTTFGVKCTSAATYEMGITDLNDRPITAGVIAGLRYDLALSAASGTGNGMEIRHQINGTMAARQPGSCANGGCAGMQTNTHKLVVTY